jgi:hypothetical protein
MEETRAKIKAIAKTTKVICRLLARKTFQIVWSQWIDDGWKVDHVKSWRTARLIYENGRKLTITVMPIASWRNGWRPWKRKVRP